MRISDWSSDVCSSDLALDLLFLDQVRNLLEQTRLVHLIWQLGDDDRLLVVTDVFEVGASAHHDTTPAGVVGIDQTRSVEQQAGGRKIRRRNLRHQLTDLACRIVDQRNADRKST